MKKKGYILFVLLLVGIFAVSACSTSPATPDHPAAAGSAGVNAGADGSFKIGICPMTLNDTFQVVMSNAAEEKVTQLGSQAVIQGASGANTDVEQQLQFIETMIANGYDGIILSPSATEGLVTAIRKCQDAGIAVIDMDAPLDTALLQQNGLEPVPHIGTNGNDAAAIAGQYVLDHYEQGVKTAIVAGVDGHPQAVARTEGFLGTCGEYIDLAAQQSGEWQVEDAFNAAQNMISANPDLELIFAESDNMVVGAVRAVQEAGLTDQIDIIGFDGTADGLNLVKEGLVVAEIAQDPVAMGQLSAQAVLDLLSGKEVELDVSVPAFLVTAENVDDALANIEAYSK